MRREGGRTFPPYFFKEEVGWEKGKSLPLTFPSPFLPAPLPLPKKKRVFSDFTIPSSLRWNLRAVDAARLPRGYGESEKTAWQGLGKGGPPPHKWWGGRSC